MGCFLETNVGCGQKSTFLLKMKDTCSRELYEISFFMEKMQIFTNPFSTQLPPTLRVANNLKQGQKSLRRNFVLSEADALTETHRNVL